MRWCSFHRRTRPVHHHADTDEGNCTTDYVGPVRAVAVEVPPPQKRQHNEEAAVYGIDSPEVARLKGRYDAIEDQDDPAQQTPPCRTIIPKPLPNQPPTADFANASDNEQRKGA